LLIATFSFTGAAMFGLLVLFCAAAEGKFLRFIALGVLLIFMVGFWATPTGYKRLVDESRMEKLDEVERSGKETTSLIWRLLNWRFLYRTWQRSPWVGYGLASSPQVNPMKTSQGIGSDPHNDYMRYLVETGILGFLAFLAFLIFVGITIQRALKSVGQPVIRHFLVVALALYGCWLLGSLNDNLITATAYQYCLWSILATAVGWSRYERDSSNSSP
jgi:O-antigen ligase